MKPTSLRSEPSLIYRERASLRQPSRFVISVRLVPVVALFDAMLRPIGEPLVGLDRSGFYEAYLASAIDASRKYLRQTS